VSRGPAKGALSTTPEPDADMSLQDPITRREAVHVAAAGLLTPAALHLAGRAALALSHAPDAWPGYDTAMVIDMLASVTPFNVPDMYARPLTPEMVENARRSGITAVNATCSASGVGADSFTGTVGNIAFWEREFDAHPGVLMKVKSVAELREAKRTRRVGVILGFQDATMFDLDLTRVDLFHALGVRIVQLTYNLRNLVGDGCLEPANAGLSAFGRQVVERMNRLGMLVDVSHVGRQSTTDAIRASSKPVAATHSGCAAVNNVPRNKSDATLREMADRGGVIGIFLMPFLRAEGQPRAADFLRHVQHAVNTCGEDHVGVGSDLSITPLDLTPEFRAKHADFVRVRRAAGISAPGEAEDVFNYVPDFNTPRRMEQVADALVSAGHSSARIEKIIGGNWLRLLGDVWT
jgi:membrane dipeptidase